MVVPNLQRNEPLEGGSLRWTEVLLESLEDSLPIAYHSVPAQLALVYVVMPERSLVA